MGKISQNKAKKKASLLESAYELFINKGFYDTTIRDIAHHAGVAKGTFYLYFRDKADIRDELIRLKATEFLVAACDDMRDHFNIKPSDPGQVADKVIHIINYIVDHASADPDLVRFISKNLSWGLFFRQNEHRLMPASDVRSGYMVSDRIDDSIDGAGSGNSGLSFEDYILKALEDDHVKIRDLKFLIFTLLELVSSACYDVLLYREPAEMRDYKPYLNHTIRLLVEDSVI